MSAITLINSTDNAKVDALIRGVIGILEMMFPQRIRGYYLVGSYADGNYVPTSDLDVVPIFIGSITSEEEAIYWQVIYHLDAISPIHLGFGLRNEEDSFSQGGVGIKIGSKLLYGEDVRDKIPLWPLDYYVQYLISARLDDMLTFRVNVQQLSFPLAYPNLNGEFYGYDQFGAATDRGTSALFGHVMVMASTLVTLKTGEYNANKSGSYEFYRHCFKDQWNDFLENLYQQCKMTWHYQIPAALPEQQSLRRLCEQVLGFENYFLEQVIPYLREQINHGSSWAFEQLDKIALPKD